MSLSYRRNHWVPSSFRARTCAWEPSGCGTYHRIVQVPLPLIGKGSGSGRGGISGPRIVTVWSLSVINGSVIVAGPIVAFWVMLKVPTRSANSVYCNMVNSTKKGIGGENVPATRMSKPSPVVKLPSQFPSTPPLIVPLPSLIYFLN